MNRFAWKIGASLVLPGMALALGAALAQTPKPETVSAADGIKILRSGSKARPESELPALPQRERKRRPAPDRPRKYLKRRRQRPFRISGQTAGKSARKGRSL